MSTVSNKEYFAELIGEDEEVEKVLELDDANNEEKSGNLKVNWKFCERKVKKAKYKIENNEPTIKVA